MEERGWAYRRRQPEGTVLYEAVRDNLAALLAEASEVGRGLPWYMERDQACTNTTGAPRPQSRWKSRVPSDVGRKGSRIAPPETGRMHASMASSG